MICVRFVPAIRAASRKRCLPNLPVADAESRGLCRHSHRHPDLSLRQRQLSKAVSSLHSAQLHRLVGGVGESFALHSDLERSAMFHGYLTGRCHGFMDSCLASATQNRQQYRHEVSTNSKYKLPRSMIGPNRNLAPPLAPWSPAF